MAALIAPMRPAAVSGAKIEARSASARAALSARRAGPIERVSSYVTRVCVAHSSLTSTLKDPEETETCRFGSKATVTTPQA